MLVIILITVFSSFILYLFIDSLLSLIEQYQKHKGYKMALFVTIIISNYFVIKRKGKVYDLVYSAFISYIDNVVDIRFVIQEKISFIKMRWWTVLFFFLLCIITLLCAGYVMIESIKKDGFSDTTELFVSSFFIISFILGLICTHKACFITIMLCLMIIPIIIKFKQYGISFYSDAFRTGWIFFDIFFLWIYLYPESLIENSLLCLGYLIGVIIGCVIKYFFGDSGGYSFNDSEAYGNVGFDTSIPEEDTVATSRGEWYERRKYVYDENGNQYEVGRSGGYIQDKSGNWIKVERDDVGEPYIRSGSENTWLK